MIYLLYMAASVAAATVTLCKAEIFRWLRALLRRWSFTRELIGCLYCTSHWVAAAAVTAARPRLLGCWAPADYVIAGLCVVTLAAPFMWVINWTHSNMDWGDDS
jgi:hypothetical protein